MSHPWRGVSTVFHCNRENSFAAKKRYNSPSTQKITWETTSYDMVNALVCGCIIFDFVTVESGICCICPLWSMEILYVSILQNNFFELPEAYCPFYYFYVVALKKLSWLCLRAKLKNAVPWCTIMLKAITYFKVGVTQAVYSLSFFPLGSENWGNSKKNKGLNSFWKSSILRFLELWTARPAPEAKALRFVQEVSMAIKCWKTGMSDSESLRSISKLHYSKIVLKSFW